MKKIKFLLVFLAGAVTYLLASLFFMEEPKDPYMMEISEEEVVNSAPAIQMYFYSSVILIPIGILLNILSI
jgi:hypothetical protein